ncbi:MAG: DUF1648 domain-containing protein [Terracidiphilus sp.]|jgi:uncharacterized membrane protein
MHKTLEVIGLGALGLLAWITYWAVNGPNPLPQRIPTHFAANGQADAWGSPLSLWLLPIVAAGVYLLISLVSLFPASFNFPVRVTPVNRRRLEALTLQMMSWIKVELVSLFLFIQWSILQSVRNGKGTLSPMMVPLFLVVVFATVGLHLAAVFRAAKVGTGR